MKTDKKYASVFELNGMPKFSQAFPLALQHVVAMIVGCVTPAIVIAGVAGLEGNDKVIFVQAALFIAAISTFIQLFPEGLDTLPPQAANYKSHKDLLSHTSP